MQINIKKIAFVFLLSLLFPLGHLKSLADHGTTCVFQISRNLCFVVIMRKHSSPCFCALLLSTRILHPRPQPIFLTDNYTHFMGEDATASEQGVEFILVHSHLEVSLASFVSLVTCEWDIQTVDAWRWKFALGVVGSEGHRTEELT